MAAVNSILFAFGPNNRYLFNAPTQWSRNELPASIEDKFRDFSIKDIHSAAFGPGDSYFIDYEDGEGSWTAWDGIPYRLENWLSQIRTAPKVSLGPDGSFFAWDKSGFCWQYLRESLVETLRAWIAGDGWQADSPRWVSLGINGSYIAFSEDNAGTWAISTTYPSLYNTLENWAIALGGKAEVWKRLHSVWLHPYEEDTWAIVSRHGGQTWHSHGSSEACEEMRIIGASVKNREKAKAMREEYDEKKRASLPADADVRAVL